MTRTDSKYLQTCFEKLLAGQKLNRYEIIRCHKLIQSLREE